MGVDDVLNRIRNKPKGSGSISDSDTVSRESESGSGRVDMDDFYSLLMALGEMQMYSHVLKKELENGRSRKEKIASETASDISGNTVEFIGTFDIPAISKKHGVDWEEDIIDKISEGRANR